VADRARLAAQPKVAGAAATVRRPDDLLLACGLAWATGLIHLQAAADHLGEYWLYGVLFLTLAAAQFAWGAAVYRSPGRRLLIAGGLGSLVVIAVWVASRTSGLPIGPTPGDPEEVGVLDVVATANELVLAALLARRLWPGRVMRGGRSAGLLKAAALLLILLSSMTLAGGLHAH
jgi:hypothetical protein